jgi:hypothetical protein
MTFEIGFSLLLISFKISNVHIFKTPSHACNQRTENENELVCHTKLAVIYPVALIKLADLLVWFLERNSATHTRALKWPTLGPEEHEG